MSQSSALGLARAAGRSAALGLCVGQLASAPNAHPPKVSGVGSQLGFQLWAPSPQFWVHTTRLQVRAGAAYPSPGAEGGGVPEAAAAAESSLTSP